MNSIVNSSGSYLNEKLKFKTFQTMTSMRNVDAGVPYMFSNLDDESEQFEYFKNRRSQLVSKHGVGSVFPGTDGVSRLTAGLDRWFSHEYEDNNKNVHKDDFKIKEWRLEQRLKFLILELHLIIENLNFFTGTKKFRS